MRKGDKKVMSEIIERLHSHFDDILEAQDNMRNTQPNRALELKWAMARVSKDFVALESMIMA